jgi:hypothetical protein
MRKGWIGLAVCAGVAAGLVWGASKPAQAAMTVGGVKSSNMSLIELAAKKKSKAKAQCTDYLLWTCCKAPGKAESCEFKIK